MFISRSASAIVFLQLLIATLAKECNVCPPEKPNLIPIPNAPKPTENGCGPQGLGALVPDYLFTNCCAVHDFCYSNCNETKKSCDDQFLQCMNQVCDEKRKKFPRLCQKIATVYHKVVAADSSCKYYQKSIPKYCSCTK
ncbi:hypothetical protein K493DRAFT_311138 [Basidiobolus meristosporus CBS 931.73]|uniref:Phospholipase A2 n=1 Tax=Basidiobolus meristosporus CBS 931.73 TaxID=1314790 RepID=A0A1Y1Z4F7_9FUNG|nr:hypothetical protein K493DRAFT_311138 [Basidiobolus meristosporus CBS 931.73]|eukprot:ORY04994.1 hypothetical protein K493DRAFT_311138 [Basidiobolus meristosporus CBS 931.73]